MSVFANGREISGKATPNKTIAAFPDVCLSPPSPPAGPVPVPYPLTGVASDTTDGTSSVFVKGKEAGKKNGVKYSKVNGNQPATNSFGANVISHKITGPLKFAAYSFDVMIEGGGAERFMDLTTQNHMNVGGGSVGMSAASASVGGFSPPDCQKLKLMNDAFREAHNDKVIKKTKDKEVTFDDSGTVAHGVYRPGSGSASAPMVGTSATQQLQAAKVNGLCPSPGPDMVHTRTPWEYEREVTVTDEGTGKKTKQKKKIKGESPASYKMKFCPGNECIHPAGGLEAHAELNILNCLPKPPKAGDSILLGIDWNSSKGKHNPNPCSNCQKTIECACEGGCIQIVICDKDGKPVDKCEQPAEPEM